MRSSNKTLTRHNLRRYALNTMLERFAIVPLVLDTVLGRGHTVVLGPITYRSVEYYVMRAEKHFLQTLHSRYNVAPDGSAYYGGP